jgi:ubiquinone/menaquinone biosynthesis methyltransferase
MFGSFGEKFDFVNKVFSSVSTSYDKMNDLMSLGTHRLWKRQFVDLIKIEHNASYLELASGSGDVADLVLKKAQRLRFEINLTASDINEDMLMQAKTRLLGRAGLDFKIVDAGNIPYEDCSFDAVFCTFGVRNFADLHGSMKEIFRVLKPGGRFYCLEFSYENVENQCLKNAYNFYLNTIIPKMGRYVAKNEEAYEYLAQSIHDFPQKAAFKLILETCGFGFVSFQDLFHGIATVHVAVKSSNIL